jgi:hypothetical protein
MINDLFERTELPSPDNKIEIFTDGNNDYTYVLPEYYPDTCINYGQLVKIREQGKVIDKERRAIYGTPNTDEIETTNVENFNGILRERISRLVRKTKCYSKQRRRLECALHLFQFYWNFMNEFRRGWTPAMLEGLESKKWSWHDFFYSQINYS